MLLLLSGIFLRSPIQILTHHTGINFNFTLLFTKLSGAVSTRLHLWWKEVAWSTCQPTSQCFSIPFYSVNMSLPEDNVFHFPFIFFNLSGLSTLLVTTCLLRLFTQDFYHGTTMIDNTKTISCTIRATYYARTTWISWKTTQQLSWHYGINRCVTSLPHVSNACQLFLKRTGISSFLTNSMCDLLGAAKLVQLQQNN